jgi:hypothetical protein
LNGDAEAATTIKQGEFTLAPPNAVDYDAIIARDRLASKSVAR